MNIELGSVSADLWPWKIKDAQRGDVYMRINPATGAVDESVRMVVTPAFATDFADVVELETGRLYAESADLPVIIVEANLSVCHPLLTRHAIESSRVSADEKSCGAQSDARWLGLFSDSLAPNAPAGEVSVPCTAEAPMPEEVVADAAVSPTSTDPAPAGSLGAKGGKCSAAADDPDRDGEAAAEGETTEGVPRFAKDALLPMCTRSAMEHGLASSPLFRRQLDLLICRMNDSPGGVVMYTAQGWRDLLEIYVDLPGYRIREALASLCEHGGYRLKELFNQGQHYLIVRDPVVAAAAESDPKPEFSESPVPPSSDEPPRANLPAPQSTSAAPHPAAKAVDDAGGTLLLTVREWAEVIGTTPQGASWRIETAARELGLDMERWPGRKGAAMITLSRPGVTPSRPERVDPSRREICERLLATVAAAGGSVTHSMDAWAEILGVTPHQCRSGLEKWARLSGIEFERAASSGASGPALYTVHEPDAAMPDAASAPPVDADDTEEEDVEGLVLVRLVDENHGAYEASAEEWCDLLGRPESTQRAIWAVLQGAARRMGLHAQLEAPLRYSVVRTAFKASPPAAPRTPLASKRRRR